ncbi:MAG: ABC transporter ATP-binding protein [Aggregatilineales bacterium]
MIDVQGLNFTYAGEATSALRDINFKVERGEIFGFLGPSGAGKSTTQKILIGLLRGYEGQVSVLGRELTAWGAAYYEQVGVSFEMPNHYLKLTALENLRYFRSLYSGATESAETVLEWVGLADDGEKRVGEFSKGMRNRLNVARSLLNKPKLLFLDEPTSGLDPVNARRIKEVIQRVRENGTTVFMTTHNMSVADELCDRVAFLLDGEINLIETPRDLKLRYGRRIVQVEFGQNGARSCDEFPLDGLGENVAFLDLLRRQPVQTIHTQETTLEQVFIDVTGRSLA